MICYGMIGKREIWIENNFARIFFAKDQKAVFISIKSWELWVWLTPFHNDVYDHDQKNTILYEMYSILQKKKGEKIIVAILLLFCILFIYFSE